LYFIIYTKYFKMNSKCILGVSLAFFLLAVGCKKDEKVSAPTVSTTVVSSIEATAATSGGNIADDGGADITERGVCWNTNSYPTITSSKTSDGTGSGSFTSSIAGLSAGSTYHVRAYATNSVGTSYGEDIAFTTGKTIPTITTKAISSITKTSASSGGMITANGGAEVTAYGVCWSTSTNPTISDPKTEDGSGTTSFTSAITGLTIETTYHVRAYATNSEGTAYGEDITLTTLSDLPAVTDNDNMLLGNPSSATADVVNANNYLMVKAQYSMSYNNSKLTTNWTSWHLYSGDLGSTDRTDDFRADATLPSGWYQVLSTDYQYSTYGFDRGHMCPSADRTTSTENNSATFLMTNMIPQAPNNNQKTWANLENYCRTLVNAGDELYIICGPYGEGGTSAIGTFSKLGSGVTVPSQTWKIVVVLSNGDNDLSRITTSTRVIAVWMPNAQSISSTWTSYRVSVDYIESQTGYDFLSNVPTSIQDVIEANVDNQ
jgi:endonuclease G, mitochondrial